MTTPSQFGRPRLRRMLWAVVVGMYALQCTVALAAWFQLHLWDLPAAVRVYGDATSVAGMPGVLRVGVYERHAMRFLPLQAVAVSVDGVALPAVTATDDDVAIVEWETSNVGTTQRLMLEATARLLPPNPLELSVPAAAPAPWLTEAAVLGDSAPPRDGSFSQAEDPPGIRLPAAVDACPWQLSVAAPGGVVARDLPVVLRGRLTTATGAPVAGVAVTAQAPDAPPSRGTTDELGVFLWEAEAAWSTTYDVRFVCQGAEVKREVVVTPSWDGISLQPMQPTWESGSLLSVRVGHQRRSGTVQADVVCDDRFVQAATAPIRYGTRQQGWRALSFESGPAVRLCVVQQYLYLLSPDSPRGAHFVLLRNREVTERAAVLELHDAAATRAPARLRTTLGPETRAALAQASDDAVRQYGLWLLASLRTPFRPMPLRYDDLSRTMEDFEATRQAGRRAVAALLALDVIMLFGFVLGVVVPAVRRQRAALRAAMEDESAEDQARVLDDRGAIWMAALGFGTVAAFCCGILILLYMMP